MQSASIRAAWRLVVIALALTLFCAQALAEQTVLEVIQLRYRTVEEIIPVLRPLMPPTATLSGMNNRLIVRTTPSNLAEVKQLLATLDATPRRLVISVRQDADLDRSQRGGQISGRAQIGDNVTVRVPGSPTPPGATVQVDGVRGKVYSSESTRSDQVSQQVQVMEGGRAWIRVGQSVPVAATQVVETPDGRRVLRSTDFHDVDVGFYVVPRLAGDRVTLEISTAADTLQSQQRSTATNTLPSPRSAATNIQRVDTVVSGRLGEWIELGAIGQQSVQRDDALLARSTDARRDDRRVLVKVDELN
jgi:type II secretory pathway component GspD/PulD (secretin)